MPHQKVNSVDNLLVAKEIDMKAIGLYFLVVTCCSCGVHSDRKSLVDLKYDTMHVGCKYVCDQRDSGSYLETVQPSIDDQVLDRIYMLSTDELILIGEKNGTEAISEYLNVNPSALMRFPWMPKLGDSIAFDRYSVGIDPNKPVSSILVKCLYVVSCLLDDSYGRWKHACLVSEKQHGTTVRDICWCSYSGGRRREGFVVADSTVIKLFLSLRTEPTRESLHRLMSEHGLEWRACTL